MTERYRDYQPAGRVTMIQEVWISSELLFSNKLSWLLILGPVALVGDSTGMLGEAACFALSGIALIPCAERCVNRLFVCPIPVTFFR